MERASATSYSEKKKTIKPGRKGFKKNIIKYKKFLRNFLEKPVFNKKNIRIALSKLFKSKITVERLVTVIFSCKKKVKNDIKILQENPDASIETIEEYELSVKKEETSKKANTTEIIESIYEEIQSLKQKIIDFQDSLTENIDADKKVTVVPPVPGSIYIKDLKNLMTSPPLIDLTLEEEVETNEKLDNNYGDLNVRESEDITHFLDSTVHSLNNNENPINSMIPELIISPVQTGMQSYCIGNKTHLKPPLTALLTQKVSQDVTDYPPITPYIHYQQPLMQQISILNIYQESNNNTTWPVIYYQ